ncbi:hypothetical protein ABK040_006640 [Willaertia magna]
MYASNAEAGFGDLLPPQLQKKDENNNILEEFINNKEKLIVIVDSIDNYLSDSPNKNIDIDKNKKAGVYARVNLENQSKLTSVKTFASNTNHWQIKIGKRVTIPYEKVNLKSGKIQIEVFETLTGEPKPQTDRKIGQSEPIKINAFDLFHPVEFSLNLTNDIQVQFRFMRSPLSNKKHFKALERGIYSLLLKIKKYGSAEKALQQHNEEEDGEWISRTPKILKSGYLLKKGQGFASWTKRYMELDDNLLLRYYASDSEADKREPLGILVIDSDAMVYVPRDEAMEKELQKQKNIEKSKEFSFNNLSNILEDEDSSITEEDNDESETNEQTINLIKRKRRELELRGPVLDPEELYPYYLLAAAENAKEQSIIVNEVIESIEKEDDQQVEIKSSSKEETKVDKFKNLVKNPKGFKFSLQCQYSVSNGKEHLNREHHFIADSEEGRKEWLSAICEHILLEEKKTDLKDPEEEITSKMFPYLDFFDLLTIDMELDDVVKCFNSFQLNVAEKMVAPLLTLFDSVDSKRTSVDLVKSAISVEIACAESAGTLFRRNSLSSKLVTLFFKVFGLRYLTKTIKPFLIKLIKENKSIEIDDEKVSTEIAEKNAELLKGLCQNVLDIIFNSKKECPIQIRDVLTHTLKKTEEKYPNCGELCVGGLLFLRFICPSLVTPQLFGLIKDSPPKNAQRTLTLITKILQNIANQIKATESKKEKFMKRVEEFTGVNIETTKKFFREISDYVPPEVDPKNKKSKEIVPDTIKLCSLEFIAHHFGEGYVKKYYNFDGDTTIEANFYKYAQRLALMKSEELDKKLKELEKSSKEVKVITKPTTTSTSTTAVTTGVVSPKDEKEGGQVAKVIATERRKRSPSISVNDYERTVQSTTVKKVDATEWEKKKEKRANLPKRKNSFFRVVKRNNEQ